MQNFISMPAGERRVIFEQTEAKLGLPARSVEKDFWVCWTLRQLFALPEFGAHLTFKGGTSLSKVWQLIARFSEDIDLVIDRKFLGFGGDQSPEQPGSGKQRKARLEALRAECRKRIHADLAPALEAVLRTALPAGEAWTLRADPNDPDEQTLLFEYPRCWSDDAARYVVPAVKIEMGARSDDWPAESVVLQSYVADAFPQIFADASCPVRVLAAERTFWEKATLLHEETYRPAGKPPKVRMARHYYDLWSLIQAGVAARAAADAALFARVVEHRSVFFRWSWMDYSTMQRGTLRLVPLDEQIAAWRSDYDAMRAEMFFGTPPTFDEVLAVVRQFEHEFNNTAATGEHQTDS